jgi:hypothetical protein
MSIKSFPFKWTCLIAFAFLGSLLISCALQDGYSDLFFFALLPCFLVSIFVSFFLGIADRSKKAVYRILINVVVCLLFLPTIHFGTYVRDRIFLTHISRFQEAADRLIKEEKDKENSEVFSTAVPLPAGYSDLDVLDIAKITSTKENITVRFLVRDSNALSHRGYMYRSDDDPAALHKEFPHTGYTHVAPHWFFFSE